jgi:hypothetical protein
MASKTSSRSTKSTKAVKKSFPKKKRPSKKALAAIRAEANRKAALTRLKKQRELMRLRRIEYFAKRAEKRLERKRIVDKELVKKGRTPKYFRPDGRPIVKQKELVEFDETTPRRVLAFMEKKIDEFCKSENLDERSIGSIWADNSAVAEVTFHGLGDRTDHVMAYFSEYIQHNLFMTKVQVVALFDPSAEAHAIEKAGAFGPVRDKYWDTYKGHSAIPTNVSAHPAKLFSDFRITVLPLIIEWTGKEPEAIRIVFYWGETITDKPTSRKRGLYDPNKSFQD